MVMIERRVGDDILKTRLVGANEFKVTEDGSLVVHQTLPEPCSVMVPQGEWIFVEAKEKPEDA